MVPLVHVLPTIQVTVPINVKTLLNEVATCISLMARYIQVHQCSGTLILLTCFIRTPQRPHSVIMNIIITHKMADVLLLCDLAVSITCYLLLLA